MAKLVTRERAALHAPAHLTQHSNQPSICSALNSRRVVLSLVFRLVREWYVRDGLEDDLAVGVDRGWEGLGRAVDRDGRGAQGA